VGYVLQGVLGSAAALEPSRAFAHAHVVVLDQDLRLLLMTDDLFDEVRLGGVDPPSWGFLRLPAGFDRTLAAWSDRGPVAYVEAEYFGGVGTQAAIVWAGGEVVLGPLVTSEAQTDPMDRSPISRALSRLGVSARGHVDEFAAVGLGRHRDLDGWLGERAE
jgi:hypothetical protein